MEIDTLIMIGFKIGFIFAGLALVFCFLSFVAFVLSR